MPRFDLAALRTEDALTDDPGAPLRIAKTFAVRLGMKRGTWTELPGGDRIWRLRITSAGAQAISLLYDRFYLPPGATMHVYNPETGMTIGAFTEANNKATRKFGTALTGGDVAVIEYFEPAAQRGRGHIEVSQVGHVYRYGGLLTGEGPGDSGSCQVDINCEEGADWQDEKKGVARIIVGGQSLCSGSLLNNSSGDGTPYFLTARHCINAVGLDAEGNPDASNWVLYWNYERVGCGAASPGKPIETTAGATVVANSTSNTNGDFALLLLDESPSAAYEVYYNGFSNATAPGTGGVGIHHPSLDYKKIATHSELPRSFDFNGEAGMYWRLNWDPTANGYSVTEGGSSGSPLFRPDGLVIGQLFGGSSLNCSDPANDHAIYGKIAYNWDGVPGATAQRRLRDWLDPSGQAGEVTVAGAYLEAPAPAVTVTSATLSGDVAESSAGGRDGCRGFLDHLVDIRMSRDPGQALDFRLDPQGSATASDYRVTPETVTLGGGAGLTAQFTVRVWDDAEIEDPESLSFSPALAGPAPADVVRLSPVPVAATVADDDGSAASELELLSEDFAGGLPATWSTASQGAAAAPWAVRADYYGSDLNGTPFLFADSDDAGVVLIDEYVTLPVTPGGGLLTAELTFLHYLQTYAGDYDEIAAVEVFDGSAWVIAYILRENDDTGLWDNPTATSVDLTPYLNPAMQVRFRYSGLYDYFWALDDIAITGTAETSPGDVTVAPFETYWGPNARIALNAPNGGGPIGQLTNLSSVDYGCLTVEVERSAELAPSYPFTGVAPNRRAFGRTFALSPPADAAVGDYAAEFFLTEAEVTEVTAALGMPVTSLGIAKVSDVDAFADVTPDNAAAQVIDWQPAVARAVSPGVTGLKATFATGFSSFGISGNVQAPVPVELISFEGTRLNADAATLTWRTAAERDNAGFEVLRSADGEDFEVLGFVEAGAVPDGIQDYAFVDGGLGRMAAYYRLRQLDYDGTATETAIVAVAGVTSDAAAPQARFSAAGQLLVQDLAPASVVTLTDATGRRLGQWRTPDLPTGELAVGPLPAGVYFVHFAATGSTTRLVKP